MGIFIVPLAADLCNIFCDSVRLSQESGLTHWYGSRPMVCDTPRTCIPWCLSIGSHNNKGLQLCFTESMWWSIIVESGGCLGNYRWTHVDRMIQNVVLLLIFFTDQLCTDNELSLVDLRHIEVVLPEIYRRKIGYFCIFVWYRNVVHRIYMYAIFCTFWYQHYIPGCRIHA